MGRDLEQNKDIRTDTDARNQAVELAKEMILMGRADIVIENLAKLNLQDQRQKLELAKEIADKNVSMLVTNMDKLNIQSDACRLDIAEVCIAKNPREVISNLDKFGITSSQFGQELASKFVVTGNINLLIRNLDKFKIDDSVDRVNLVNKIASVQAFCGVLIDNIYKFKIEDPKDRLDIVNKLIQKGRNEYRIINNIDRFDIPNEMDRVDIIKKLAHNNSQFIISNIEKFNIREAENMLNITGTIIQHLSEELLLNLNGDSEVAIEYSKRLSKTMLDKACNSVDITSDLEYKLREYEQMIANIEKLKKFYKEKPRNVNLNLSIGNANEIKLNEVIANIKEERRQDDAKEIIEKVAFLINNLKVRIDRNDELVKIIEELITIRNPKLKEIIFPITVKFIKEDKLGLVKEEIGHNDKKKAYPAINAIIFDKLFLYSESNSDILNEMRTVFSKNSFLKNSKEVQETMKSLIRIENLNIEPDIKKSILRFLIKNERDISKNFRYIMAIVSLKDKDSLKGIDQNSDKDTLKNLFYGAYNQYINIENDEAFYKEYEKFVNREDNLNRNLEELLIIYISKNKAESELMKVIEKYVRTMSDLDKFRDARYDIDKNKHLEALNESNNEVYQKWSKGQSKFKLIDTSNTAQITDDPVDLFLIGTEIDNSCQNIEYGEKLNKCLMGYVMDGKNKAVVIKNDEGRIIARSIIRLLINKETKEVVMTKEKLYKVNNLSEEINHKLEDRCIEYAKWLGVPLICERDPEEMYDDIAVWDRYKGSEKYTGTLVSMGSFAPYEYVDMGLGYTDGEYEVDNEDLLYLYK